MVWVIIGAHGPLVAALWMTYRQGGVTAVKHLLRAGFQSRIAWTWWLLILALPFLLAGAAMGVSMVFSNYQPDLALLSQPIMILPTFVFMFFFGGSVQEEFGWRGYALPRLLQRYNSLTASLILGAVWGVWHLPLFYIRGASQSFMSFWVFVLLTLGFSVFFTWFYIRTAGNLFSSLLFHTAINTAFSVFPPFELRAGGNQSALFYLMLVYGVGAALLLLKDRMLVQKNTGAGPTLADTTPDGKRLHKS